MGDIGTGAVLIGGQVLAAERMSRGEQGLIEVETRTGVRVQRGYSFEPDVLFDLEDREATADTLPVVLRQQGYERARDFRWQRTVGEVDVSIDLFRSEDAPEPTGMTILPSAPLVLGQPERVAMEVQGKSIEFALPSPAAYVAMKVEAKLKLRPRDPRDCFDLYAYLCQKSPESIAQSLAANGWSRQLVGPLRELFVSQTAPGTKDVLTYAATLDRSERELVAQDVVDRFSELFSLVDDLLKQS
jgi:hypothetical protein